MSTEIRFLLAIALMLLVLVGTNLLFPPVAPEDQGAVPGDTAGMVAPETVTVQPPGTAAAPETEGERAEREEAAPPTTDTAAGEAVQPPVVPERATPEEATGEAAVPSGEPGVPEREVVVEGPLYRYTFSTYGARLMSAVLPTFRNLHGEGPVQLIPESADGVLGQRFVVDRDTVDLRNVPFRVEPESGVTLREGGPSERLRFVYEHPTAPFRVELTYVFHPDAYLTDVEGSVTGLDRPILVTDLGRGLEYNEADSAAEARMMAYVGNHLEDGISAETLGDVEEPRIDEGPFLWAAFKSKFFVLALLPGAQPGVEDTEYLGGLLVQPVEEEGRAEVAATQTVESDGSFDYQLFVGPLEYARLSALGDDLEEVNPYGWRFFRPIIRPFVGVIMTIFNFLHNALSIGYGWVLILFGILMRVVLWPLYMKSMRAQMRNMAVQPLLKEIQTKYKDNPERLQKEMMKLYKEHGFNPLGGCLPMLLPWPILIALFFVFQNTIELRGVEFFWLPDLSAPDPLYILPVFLAASMFLVQFISYRSMGQDNQQMKMMMWIMPLFMGFIFMNFASGLNLYYATANLAMIPQQMIIAEERKKARAKGPVKRKDDDGE